MNKKHGIYGFHYQGMYYEGLFKNNYLLECYVDYFNSNFKISDYAIYEIESSNLKNFTFIRSHI